MWSANHPYGTLLTHKRILKTLLTWFSSLHKLWVTLYLQLALIQTRELKLLAWVLDLIYIFYQISLTSSVSECNIEVPRDSALWDSRSHPSSLQDCSTHQILPLPFSIVSPNLKSERSQTFRPWFGPGRWAPPSQPREELQEGWDPILGLPFLQNIKPHWNLQTEFPPAPCLTLLLTWSKQYALQKGI